MGGLLSIVESIRGEAKAEAEKIMAAAREEERAILLKAEQDRTELEEEMENSLQEKCMNLAARIESAAEAEARRIILAAKKEAVDKTVEHIKQRIKNAGDSEYFEFLEELCKRYREEKNGVMYLCQADIERLPKDFAERINAGLDRGKITISQEAAKIDSGFIIRYDKIDINCTVDSIFEDKKNRLTDIINEGLLKE